MPRLRSHRLTITLFVVLSLLFSQMALAQYVCPQQASMKAMAAMAASGPSCDGMDEQQPTLCHQHAADPGAAFEAMKLPAVSAPALLQVLEVPWGPGAQEAAALPPTARSEEPPPPPDPLFLSTLRLRV